MRDLKPTTFTLLAAAAAMTGASASGQLAVQDFTAGTLGPIYGADVFSDTSSTPGAAKPLFTIADDTANGGSGNALFVESAGSGAEWTAFMDNSITLVDVGDAISLEFDWRLNGSATAQGLAPDTGDFRFSLHGDVDNSIGSQFGTISTYDENDVLISEDPAIFGSTNGGYNRDPLGTPASNGPIDPDPGVHVRTGFNRFVTDPNASPSPGENPFNDVRIRNENANDQGIMSGGGGTIVFGGAEGDGSVVDLTQDGNNYGELRAGNYNTFRLDLSVEDDGGEKRIRGTYTVTNALGTTIMSDTDPFNQLNFDGDANTMDDAATFDYVVFSNSVGDFDYVIDNLRVFDPNAVGGLEGDYNADGFVSQGDLDLVLLNWGDAVAPAGFEEGNIPGGGPFDGLMSQNELDGVLLNWGDGTPPPASTIPEPTSLALLGLGGLAMLQRRRA